MYARSTPRPSLATKPTSKFFRGVVLGLVSSVLAAPAPAHYASSLNREDASRYSRRHNNRLINTTTVAMINVAASNTSNRPESLALLIVLPNPGAETIFP